jgi:hypothetical protein
MDITSHHGAAPAAATIIGLPPLFLGCEWLISNFAYLIVQVILFLQKNCSGSTHEGYKEL